MADERAEEEMATSTESSSSDLSPAKTTKLTRRQLATLYSLCFVNFLKYMDRFTIAGILTQIQCEFGMNDAQGGLLSTVFVVAYMVCAPIFGYLGDRYSRKLLMGSGILIWSTATLIGSFMPNFGSFLAMRIIVGIGEAMFSTVSPTLISDICVGNTRSNFLIIYYFAIPVGSGLGFVLGSSVANAAGDWRWGLRVTPILGLIGILLITFVVQEPKRGESEGSKLESTSYWDDVKYLAKNKSYVTSNLGVTLVTYVSGGLAWWGPKYFSMGIAQYQGEGNVDVDSVSTLFGVTATVAGIAGVWTGSVLGQKLRVRYPSADALVCAWGMIIAAPLSFWGILRATGVPWATYVIVTIAQWFMNLNWAPSGDILLYVVIPPRRATGEGMMLLVTHALGDAISPYIIGLVSDAFRESLTAEQASSKALMSYPSFRDSSTNCSNSDTIDFDTIEVDYASLQYSMMITVLLEVLGAFFFFMTAWYLVEDKGKVDRAIAAQKDADTAKGISYEVVVNNVKSPSGLVVFDPRTSITRPKEDDVSSNNSSTVDNKNNSSQNS